MDKVFSMEEMMNHLVGSIAGLREDVREKDTDSNQIQEAISSQIRQTDNLKKCFQQEMDMAEKQIAGVINKITPTVTASGIIVISMAKSVNEIVASMLENVVEGVKLIVEEAKDELQNQVALVAELFIEGNQALTNVQKEIHVVHQPSVEGRNGGMKDN